MTEQNDKCPDCRGRGIRFSIAERFEFPCPTCNGTGEKKLDSPDREREIADMLSDWKDAICLMARNDWVPTAKSPFQIAKEIIALIPDCSKCKALLSIVTIPDTSCVGLENCCDLETRLKEAKKQERERIAKDIHSIEFESNSATDFLNKTLYYLKEGI